MGLTLYERRQLRDIERRLADDPMLRALSAMERDDGDGQPRERHPHEPHMREAAASQTNLIRGEPAGGGRRERLLRSLRVALAVALLCIGPAMLVPALLTGVSWFAIPVFLTPLACMMLLAVRHFHRRKT